MNVYRILSIVFLILNMLFLIYMGVMIFKEGIYYHPILFPITISSMFLFYIFHFIALKKEQS